MHYTLLSSPWSLIALFHFSTALSPARIENSGCSSKNINSSIKSSSNRRNVIEKLVSVSSSMLITSPAYAIPQFPSQQPQPQPQGSIQGAGGSITRVEGLGGGFDLTTSMTTKGVDVIYPKSLEGRWNCRRVVTSVEGDAGQAELAWRTLGGFSGGGKSMVNYVESFDTQFIIPPESLSSTFAVKNEYQFENEVVKGTILDRGFEMESRTKGSSVVWNLDSPDVLSYERDNSSSLSSPSTSSTSSTSSTVEIVVVQRKVEMPSGKGFGFDELYRVTSSAGGIFGENKVQRAVRVKRRYRRAIDEANGGRVVEGLEIMKTYRVLDGIAGVEMPTSTTKSQIKLTR